MVNRELGRLEEVDLRSIWSDEARDFTPWLAEHLDQLSAALGLDLEFTEQEAGVGPFAVDILAEADDAVVVIENQLERTDHSHLGQLLTYAAGRDAWTLIWITPELRDEHRAVLDWLNRWTTDEIKAYGVELRAVRIGDSAPAPEFRPVAFPNDWSRQAKSRGLEGSMSSDERNRRIKFFDDLADRALARKLTDSTGFGSVTKSKMFPCRVDERGIKYRVELRASGLAAIQLEIRTGDMERNESIVAKLADESTAIAQELDFEPEFFPPDPSGRRGRIKGAVTAFRQASIDDPDQFDETLEWCLETLSAFQQVLDPRLRAIIAQLGSEDSSGA